MSLNLLIKNELTNELLKRKYILIEELWAEIVTISSRGAFN